MRTLILGGTRSGKSARAEALRAAPPAVASRGGGGGRGGAAGGARRVQAHRDRRDTRFTTVETTDLAGQLRDGDGVPTLIDDLGNWVTALLDATGGWDDPGADLAAEITELATAVAAYDGDLVIVSPEVGLSVVPSTNAGRRFADVLGAANLAVAAACDDVELVVAGRILRPVATTGPLSRRQTEADPHRPAPPSEAAPHQPAPPSEVRAELEPGPEHAGRSLRRPAAEGSKRPPATAAGPTDADFPPVDLPDETVAEQARARLLTLTKPPGSLGRLEDLVVWVSSCQGVCPPRRIVAPQVAVFAGDHGVARDGVSAFPPEVTAQMVANIASGGAAVNVLARRAGAAVQVLDMSVDTDDADPVVARYKVRRSTGDLRRGQAMTLDEARRSVAAGRAVADELVDAGADLLIAGDMGIGNTTPAAVLTGIVTGKEPVVVVGRGTGIDDAAWIRKTAAIRDGMRFGRPHRHDPLNLLAAVAGPDLAAMAGFLAQAAVRRTPAILDGMVVTSAALVANLLAPGASAWWCAGHRSTEPAHGFALLELGLEPILDLSMRLGEGSGAVTALPVVTDAVDILIDMATFTSAGVDDGS
ncbi:nicotinate-nucleotide--dimethylbenzimidazole phosphoribosyltransferase [Gordonia sp. (in: high G+C Gram-positive bacteria)]|uniref:nicotinate-nucleotide--dimethylbenzimidazole phosphoribosyltransferase n=1 Tax=Gordonia sp. (in: high G+C Gram-positive bacteria) TaxID=84139 RepID=UPI0026144D81|nr:nicotinate-nucleotide--dimethylbenzimidazole phosphoribosyltransferase [Gordonia sp. (in: high G+C Gram-positive bacteria)]